MNTENDESMEIQRQERELQERERALRLRELELEINQQPLYQAVQQQESESSLKRWSKKLVLFGKFLGIIVAVLVSIQISQWLVGVIIVGSITWVAYKIFFEGSQSKN